MDKKKNRRDFLKKGLAATVGGVLAGSGLSAISKKENAVNPITSIKPLGFQWPTRDPFLFCVHHEDAYPKGDGDMAPPPESLKGRNLGSDFHIKDGWRMYHGKTIPGFPGHPHRGFETITVVRKGMVDHSDSIGGAGRYGDGDVQWMTAGKGLQHSEMFPLVHQDKDNPLELFQIWLNLPKAAKMVEPHFKMLWAESIPHVETKDGNGKKTLVEVIAGKLGTDTAPTPPPNSWAADAGNEVQVFNIRMEAGATWQLPAASEGVNRTIYFYSGDTLSLDGHAVPNYHAAEVLATEELTVTAGGEDCHLLILQGKPIGEPVVQHGPFVMNSREEVRQAFNDYQRTRFGGWPWPKPDHVHEKGKGRFALYPDGRLETKA